MLPTLHPLSAAKAEEKSDQQATASSPSTPADKYSTRYGSHLEPILQAIRASSDQRKKITDMVEENRPKIEPLRQKYREKQKQFLAAMMSGSSAEDIMAKQEELSSLDGQIVNAYCVLNLKVRKVLTSDQIPLYEAYRMKQGWTSSVKATSPQADQH